MFIIMTGTIRPSDQVNQLVLKNEDERFTQYEESLRFLLESRACSKIVFCENSNYGTERLYHLKGLAEKNKIELELLSFPGNVEQTRIHGKGYGEGEIMNYVFTYSKLAATDDFFVKITGRLQINNIKDIIVWMKKDSTYFNIPNRTRRDIYDTRIYGMPMEQFKKYFQHSYNKVMDDQGIFLEMVYTDILVENSIYVTNFPRYPRVIGMSGSNGITYGYTEWKCKVRDILSKFNFYIVKRV
ncbi:hypothetical protein EDD76_104125 [Kineothrix alysoides]|uniref:Uncharacterized protein n=1 Tax=Kineothrix alysoides TaxID=1469948 RepID=A0A4R1R245_9FIRM|nr:hypothetical protein [Kineothrix alysoides]TCL59388.1 hypothetical protein EDD76_104125 [Kineothrix alysoides]